MNIRTGWLTPLLAAFLLVGCAGDMAIRDGKSLLAQGKIEEALARLDAAVKENPENVEYRAYQYRQRQFHIQNLLTQADSARGAGRFDEAAAIYHRVLKLDENTQRATDGLQALESARRRNAVVAKAEEALKAGDPEQAERLVRGVLSEDPSHAGASGIKRNIDEAASKTRAADPVLKAIFKKPVTLEFKDANLKSAFEVISRTSGINFIFDKDVKSDLKTTIFVKDSSIEDVINMMLVTNQLEKRMLNDNTVLIYPNIPAKVKDYQELTVKTFYLTNADPKQMMNTIKTMLKTRDIVIDERLNTLTIRDTPNAIRLAEKLVASNDMADPEVVLEVEVLEIKRSRLTELGIQWPNQFTVLNILNSNTVTSSGGTVVATTPTVSTAQLTLQNLRHINSASIGIPNPSINLRGEDSDTNLLANPRIRVRNREKAKIHIGDRVPVITTTATANVGVAESVTYLDVGLKLEVEPRIYPDNDVAMKVGMEVSSIVREIKSSTGTLTYQLGTRDASTTLRLKDGETQALAGLINNEDRASASKVPGLGDIPLLGHLFASHRNEGSKTEIVLLITPHIVRNLIQPDPSVMEFASGTDSAAGASPLSLKPAGSYSMAASGTAAATGSPDDAAQISSAARTSRTQLMRRNNSATQPSVESPLPEPAPAPNNQPASGATQPEAVPEQSRQD